MGWKCRLLQHNWMPLIGSSYRCERCGARWDAGTVTRPNRVVRPTDDPTEKLTLGDRITVGIFFALVIGGTGGYFYYKSIFPDDPDHDRRQKAATAAATDAYYICEQFVQGQLKAPATAQFPGRNQSKITGESDGGYLVMLPVDAQNSFGAMLRKSFVCSVKQTGDGWRLRSLVEG